jgi:hypothetical protein
MTEVNLNIASSLNRQCQAFDVEKLSKMQRSQRPFTEDCCHYQNEINNKLRKVTRKLTMSVQALSTPVH